MTSSEPVSAQGDTMAVDTAPRKPRILLAASGSVAAVKFANLCHCFSEWAELRAVVTSASLHFIDRAAMPKDVILYTDEDEWSSWKKLGDSVLHIELRRWADIMVIAPLSANTLGKIAGGLCDNLLTCIVRAWDYSKPFFVAPAMNTFMWNNPFTERHLISIDELGISLIPPVTKRLACGDYGNGAMAEPSTIYSTVRLFYESKAQQGTGEGSSNKVGRTGSTRGGPLERTRPTTSERRERACVAIAEKDNGVDARHKVPVAATDVPVQQVELPRQDQTFPGGPEDLSVLKSYNDHVARLIWDGEDRGALKIVNHGRKLEKSQEDHVMRVVSDTGLAPLVECSHTQIDRGLISAFAERWHKDTCTFHLPVGEMTITLDDVSSLLHLPVTGDFFSHPPMSREIAVKTLVELLGVTTSEATLETDTTRGAQVRFNWLRDVYDLCIAERRMDDAARAYLLHLVGCTIFADKSATYVRVMYLELFRDLTTVGRFAWGAAALAYLYEQLGDASFYKTRQMAGYMTLLQAWIFEHFPHIGSRQANIEFRDDWPLCRRLTSLRSNGVVVSYRRDLDRLHEEEISWTPYTSHRAHRPFHDISWYSGYIRCDSLVHPHLPERVLRQYGYQQGIPRSPYDRLGEVKNPDDIDNTFHDYHLTLVDEATRGALATYPGECTDGYMEWFRKISHPYLIPSSMTQALKKVDKEAVRMPDSSSSGTQDDLKERLQRIAELLQGMLDRQMVTEGTEAAEVTHDALSIARDDIHDPSTYQRKKKTRPNS